MKEYENEVPILSQQRIEGTEEADGDAVAIASASETLGNEMPEAVAGPLSEEQDDSRSVATVITLNPDGAATKKGKNPISKRKLEANRKNGQKSDGPKTDTGKARSRTNALKHGLYSNLPLADLKNVRGVENLEAILAELRQAYPPQTIAQAILLEEMALGIWRRNRAMKYEVRVSEEEGAFNCERSDKAIRLCLAVHKMTEHAFAKLEQLDQNPVSEDEADAEEKSRTTKAAPSTETNGHDTPPRKRPRGVATAESKHSVG